MRAPGLLVLLACAAGAACSASELRALKRGERGAPVPATGFAAAPPPAPPVEAKPSIVEPAPVGAAELDASVVEEEPPLAFEEPAVVEPLHEVTPEYQQPSLTSIARQTFVFSKPSFKAQKIGYLRVGAVVSRSDAPVGNEGCKRGWYRIQPEGYVCTENAAILDTEGESPFAHLATVRPDRMAPMPYRYGRSRYPTPPFYTRLPSKLDQERSEQELTGHLRARTAEAWKSVPNDPTPTELLEGKSVPIPWGFFRQGNPLTTGRAMPDSGFALLGIYDHEGRRFALNTDFQLIPLDRIKPVEISSFHGIQLDENVTLPVVFVRSSSAHLYAGDPKKTGLNIARRLAYREAVPISGREVIVSGIRYLETKTGDWLRNNERVVRIDKFKNKPGWASGKRSWLHVSILQQSLVMYAGETPVYATLVSTGQDGLGDPLETKSTVRGQFLVHTKHVSVTMDSDAEGDQFDLRDVPYVQYFHEGYALHAAFWHDSFGQPYSHGCINLSPLDARALFHMTDPPVPQTWHGAMSLNRGTLVHITP